MSKSSSARTTSLPKRDAAATRARILQSAQNAFTAKGYAGAGLREIATDAGVNQALVKRYFGSKEHLFKEAVVEHLTLAPFLQGPVESLGHNLATHFATKTKTSEELDPTLALLRSMASSEAHSLFKEQVERILMKELVAWLPGRHKRQRAALLLGSLIGFDLIRRIFTNPALTNAYKNSVIKLWGNSLQQLINP